MKKFAPFVLIGLLSVLAYCNQKYFLSVKSADEVGRLSGGKTPEATNFIAILLGPLRGLIVNALWWRVVEQQDDGNYFEIMQLSDWITKLQPDNPKAWAYQAWNLSYNVAYNFPDGDSKWKWVHHAMKLLFDDGLKYNHDDKGIRKELARIFYDKIGGTVDPGSEIYKRKLAEIVVKYLPDGVRKDIERLFEAPLSEAELRKIPGVNELLAESEKNGINLLDRNTFFNSMTWTDKQKKCVESVPGFKESMIVIDSFIKAKGIKEELGVVPERMLFIDREYGPFDWRLFQAYTVYWLASSSTWEEFLEKNQYEQSMIRQAMTSSLIEGRLLYDPDVGIFTMTENIKILGKLHDYYDYMMGHHYTRKIDYLHKSFLEQAAAILYTFNQVDDAKDVFEHYKEGYLDKDADFETYIAGALFKTVHDDSMRDTRALVEMSLFQAFNWLATGDVQKATGYANFAKLAWSRHQKENAANPGRLLPSFEKMKSAALKKFMEGNAAPQFKQRLLNAVQTKEFSLLNERTATGEIYKKSNVYEKRIAPLGKEDILHDNGKKDSGFNEDEY